MAKLQLLKINGQHQLKILRDHRVLEPILYACCGIESGWCGRYHVKLSAAKRCQANTKKRVGVLLNTDRLIWPIDGIVRKETTPFCFATKDKTDPIQIVYLGPSGAVANPFKED